MTLTSRLARFAWEFAILLCLAMSVPTVASATPPTTVCVHNQTELQDALTAAQGSTAETFILIVRGTYTLTDTMTFYSLATNQGQLDVTGGYNDDCSANIENPALTVLDGGGAIQVMSLESWNGISVRWLTFQNGYSANQATSLSVETIVGGLIVHYNIFRNNNSASFVGTLYAFIAPDNFSTTSTANLDFSDNLIANNTASTNYAGGSIGNQGTGTIYFTNNTVTHNIVTANTVGLVSGVDITGDTFYVSNNILYANTANTYDLYMSYNTAPVLIDNDYQNRFGAADPSSTGNVAVDPQFSSGTDFHLLPTSPLLGQGTLTPAGGLVSIDVDGNPRSYGGAVDMGAYERGDEIFKDAFE